MFFIKSYRYSILQNGGITPPTSALELASDVNALRVVTTNNYQQLIKALWRGYYTIGYNDNGSLAFEQYQYLTSERFRDHFDVQRIRGMSFM